MMRSSIRRKLAAAVLSLAGVAALATSIALGRAAERDARVAAGQSLREAAKRLAIAENQDIERFSAALDVLTADPEMKAAFIARDRHRLFEDAVPIYEALKAREDTTHWYFIDPEPWQTVFLRVHKPELFGDRVERPTLERAVETRTTSAGKELGKTAFALRVVKPYYAAGRLIGYMELGENIQGLLERMKAQSGDEFGLLVKKKFLNEKDWASIEGTPSSTWNDRPDVVLVHATSFGDGLVDFGGDLDAVPDEGTVLEELTKNQRDYVRGTFPLRDAIGRRVGALFVLHDVTAMRAAMRSDRWSARLGFIGIALLAMALLVAGLGGSFSRSSADAWPLT